MPLMRAYLHEAGSEVHALMTLGQRPDCSVVFVLVAVFVLKAVLLSSAIQSKGLDAVFRSVNSSGGGSWLLAVLASGLVCYGLYCRLASAT
jgi:hypothetical protein